MDTMTRDQIKRLSLLWSEYVALEQPTAMEKHLIGDIGARRAKLKEQIAMQIENLKEEY